MKRADAFALVERHGGTPRRGVTKETLVLIVGELGWPLLADGRPSNSLEQAKGYGIPIASERKFLEWTGKAFPTDQTKTYTTDQLVALSKVPEKLLEQLTMFGLVEPKDGHFGFRDQAAYLNDIPDPKRPGELKGLAAHIVESKAGSFDPTKFEDHYESALVELLRAKQAGAVVQPRKEEAQPQRVINLMDALRKSIGEETKKKPAAPSARARTSAKKAAGR